MKPLVFAAITLLALTLSCAPVATSRPTVAVATAAATASLTPTSVTVPALKPTATFTPTPTPTVLALEQTPTPEVTASQAKAIWGGTIISDSSREYMANGKQVATCNTSWTAAFYLSIDPAGRVAGSGAAKLDSMKCSPLSRTGNTTQMNIKIDGTKDDSDLKLRLSIESIVPSISGDFGGYDLLFGSMACPPVQRTLSLPLTSPKRAQASLLFSGTMTGCAGSKDDAVSSNNLARIEYFAECSNLPPDLQMPEVEALCR